MTRQRKIHQVRGQMVVRRAQLDQHRKRIQPRWTPIDGPYGYAGAGGVFNETSAHNDNGDLTCARFSMTYWNRPWYHWRRPVTPITRATSLRKTETMEPRSTNRTSATAASTAQKLPQASHAYLMTEEAARFLRLSPRTLERFRVEGQPAHATRRQDQENVPAFCTSTKILKRG